MKQITILFKSGATIEFTAHRFNGTKNGFGNITSLNWDCTGLVEYPIKINLDNIDAIMVKEV